MEYSKVEQVILQRFFDKSRLAGGPRAGYMLRRKAICGVNRGSADLDFGPGLESLVEKGILPRVQIEIESHHNGNVKVRIKGTVVSLSEEQARAIQIQPILG